MTLNLSALASQNPQPMMAVSFRFLLSLYSIIPLCILLQCIDQYGLNYTLRENLPNSPGHFLLFQLLFGTPHIIASSLLLTQNTEYWHCFKSKILAMSLFIILFFGIGSLFIPYRVLYIITACWTVYHVLKQQHGVAKVVCRLPYYAFYLQLGLSIIAGIFIYLGIFLNNSLTPIQSEYLFYLASFFSLGLFCATLINQKYPPDRFGVFFLWANTLLVLVSLYLFAKQYYFLAILMPRLVHDLTAYSFYISHDVNRYNAKPSGIFKLFKLSHIPIALVAPVLSLLLTFLLQSYGDILINSISQTLFSTEIHKAVTLGLFGYLALMHYYTESFVWTADSPLRRYIRFSR